MNKNNLQDVSEQNCQQHNNVASPHQSTQNHVLNFIF